MPNPIAVLAGGQLLGAGLSYKGAKDANKAADRREAAAMAFEQKKYDDWKAIYGPIEENLANYYKTLTPKAYAVRGVEEFNKQKESALTRIRENFTQRGIRLDSNIALSTEASVAMEGAKQTALIRSTAEDKVREQKQSFLTAGLSKNPDESMSSLLENRASDARRTADDAALDASKAIRGAISSTTSALSDYLEEN